MSPELPAPYVKFWGLIAVAYLLVHVAGYAAIVWAVWRRN